MIASAAACASRIPLPFGPAHARLPHIQPEGLRGGVRGGGKAARVSARDFTPPGSLKRAEPPPRQGEGGPAAVPASN